MRHSPTPTTMTAVLAMLDTWAARPADTWPVLLADETDHAVDPLLEWTIRDLVDTAWWHASALASVPDTRASYAKATLTQALLGLLARSAAPTTTKTSA